MTVGHHPHSTSAAERAKLLEARREREQLLQAKLRAAKGGKNHFPRMIAAVLEGRTEDVRCTNAGDQAVVGLLTALADRPRVRATFKDLLMVLHDEGCDKLLHGMPHLIALSEMAGHTKRFKRPIGAWTRPSRNMDKQFASLLRHCLAQYPVPSFMDQAWCDPARACERKWYIDIGEGRNIRHSIGLPFPLTKRMAHCFLNMPGHRSLDEAMRYAQVLGLGGDAELAEAVAAGRLGRNSFEQEDYWSTVIAFLVRHPIAAPKLSEVIDFLSSELTEGRPVNMRGRTAASLTRLSDTWHVEINRRKRNAGDVQWTRSIYQDAAYVVGKDEEGTRWTVRELLSSQQLATEGRTLRHCVSSYAGMCAKRITAIFSIGQEDLFGQSASVATVEVSLKTGRVVQAKSKYNAKLKARPRMILEKWAKREGLIVNEHL